MNDEEFKKRMLEGLAGVNERLIALETGQTAMSTRLDKLDERLDHLEKEASALRTDIEARFAEIRSDVRIVYDGVTAVLDQQDVEAKERMHFEIVLKRHERWITGLANHAKVELNRS